MLLWGVDICGNIGKDQRSRLLGCLGRGEPDPHNAFTESDAAVILSYCSMSWVLMELVFKSPGAKMSEMENFN